MENGYKYHYFKIICSMNTVKIIVTKKITDTKNLDAIFFVGNLIFPASAGAWYRQFRYIIVHLTFKICYPIFFFLNILFCSDDNDMLITGTNKHGYCSIAKR